jgi:hypothetical protein
VAARQIGSIKSGAATGASRLPEAPEGGVQAALCGKQRQGRRFESTIRRRLPLTTRLPIDLRPKPARAAWQLAPMRRKPRTTPRLPNRAPRFRCWNTVAAKTSCIRWAIHCACSRPVLND